MTNFQKRMKKILLSLMLAFTATLAMQAQNEYSTLVVETTEGAKVEVWLKNKPQVKVTDTEFIITCGEEVTGYVHEKVKKFYFKPYDPKTGIEAPVAENVIRIAYLDQSQVTVSGVEDTDEVRLYTLDGRAVSETCRAEGASVTVSLDALAPGTYILNIANKQSFKLLKR